MLAFIALAMTSPTADFSAADLADAKCIMVAASTAKAQTDPAKSQSVMSAAIYFVGKIKGRNDATDLEALMRAVAPMPAAQIAGEARRCGSELKIMGASMIAIGKSLSADGL